MPGFPARPARTVLAAALLSWLPIGHAQIAIVSPGFIDFGEVKFGAAATVTIQLRNLTGAPLTPTGGGFGDDYGFIGSLGNCPNPIPANASCQLVYGFFPRLPNQTAEDATTLTLSGSGQTLNARIAVRGTSSEPLIQVTPRGIDFGEELIGQTVTVPMTYTNTAATPVQTAGGSIAAPFGATSTCGGGGGPLAAGASCQMLRHFTPAQVNEATGSGLFFAYLLDSDREQNFPLQARGRGRTTPGPVHVAPVGLDFGAIKIGSEVSVPVTFTNRTATVMTVAGGGFNNNDNAFASNASSTPGCAGGLVPPQTACTVNYRFLPRERRAHQAATVLLFSQAGGFNQEVALSFTGTGVGTLARVSPVDVGFGDIDPGTQVTVTVAIVNTSPVALTNFLGGITTGAFTRVTNTCPASLAAGALCTMTYRYLPQAPGTFTATTFLSYQGNGAVESTQVTLAGTSGTAIFINGFQ